MVVATCFATLSIVNQSFFRTYAIFFPGTSCMVIVGVTLCEQLATNFWRDKCHEKLLRVTETLLQIPDISQ